MGIPALVAHRHFDESPIAFASPKWEVQDVSYWLKMTGIPSMFEFGEEWVDLIFTQSNPALFLFFKPEDGHKGFVKAV